MRPWNAGWPRTRRSGDPLMAVADVRPGIWGRLEREAAQTPAPEGDGQLWQRLSDMVDPGQFRPKLADDVEIKEFHLKWGNDYAMIANPRDLLHFKLEPGEVEIVKLMDGTRTVKEIVLERFKESGDLELSAVADLVKQLYTGNFLDILSPVAVNYDGYRETDDPGICDNRTLSRFST